MAFPLPANQLLTHIRASFVAINDNEASHRTIKPTTIKESDSQDGNLPKFANLNVLESPPLRLILLVI